MARGARSSPKTEAPAGQEQQLVAHCRACVKMEIMKLKLPLAPQVPKMYVESHKNHFKKVTEEKLFTQCGP